MFRKLYEVIFERELELRERLFRIILLIGAIANVLSLAEVVLLKNPLSAAVPLLVLFGVIVFAIMATFKYRRIKLQVFVMGMVMICIALPFTFFLNGGIEGGATIWFVVGIFFVFLMYSGRTMICLLVFTIAVDIGTYVFAYYHSDWIVKMSSDREMYTDSIFSVLMVGLVVGALMKFETMVYEKERKLNDSQKKELERVSHSKDTFFASMSHEIRTPINTILGLNEVILRENASDEIRENAVNIQNAGKMLLALVNDILDWSQIENKRMEIIPVRYETRVLFEELVAMMQLRMKEKKLDFQVDIDKNIPSVLYGDEKRIKQIVLNLLTNAWKYTKQGSVTLSVRGEMQEDDMVTLTISVADTGIGIKKEDMSGLFDIFSRADEEKNINVEGSGLGLSISKQLVDMMGGRIMVDSIYTKGSIFTVVLTQKALDTHPIGMVNLVTQVRETSHVYRQSFEAPEARVLVVDDDERNLLVARKLLEATKVQIDTATGGEECLELTRKKYYHVILLDYRMPKLDGASTLKLIRKQEHGMCREVPVIAFSADMLPGAKRENLDYEFDGYLSKPVDGRLLEETILNFLPEDIIEYRMQEAKEGLHTVQRLSKRKRKKIYITSDCVCDVPKELAEKYDIRLLYLYIRVEKACFCDTKEIDAGSLSHYMSQDKSRADAISVPVEEIENFFAETLTEAEDVVHISMARHAGESYHNAKIAARGFDHVHVINAGHISCGQGILVLAAAKMVQEGLGVQKICDEIEYLKERIESGYILPTASVFFQKGYTDKYTAAICDMFHLHPILRMHQSSLIVCGVGCGKLETSWRHYIRRSFLFKKRIDNRILYVTYAGLTAKQLETIVEEARKYIPFRRIIVQPASVSTTCNAGLGTFGMAYLKKTRE